MFAIRGMKPRDRSGTLAASHTHLHFLRKAKTSHATSNERWSTVEARRVHHLADFSNKQNTCRATGSVHVLKFQNTSLSGSSLRHCSFLSQVVASCLDALKLVVLHSMSQTRRTLSPFRSVSASASRRLSRTLVLSRVGGGQLPGRAAAGDSAGLCRQGGPGAVSKGLCQHPRHRRQPHASPARTS